MFEIRKFEPIHSKKQPALLKSNGGDRRNPPHAQYKGPNCIVGVLKMLPVSRILIKITSA